MRVSYQDKTGRLPWFILIRRSDMLYASDGWKANLGAYACRSTHSPRKIATTFDCVHASICRPVPCRCAWSTAIETRLQSSLVVSNLVDCRTIAQRHLISWQMKFSPTLILFLERRWTERWLGFLFCAFQKSCIRTGGECAQTRKSQCNAI